MSGIAEMSGEQAATFFAYFPDGSAPTPSEHDAYVHVRVTQPVRPTGSLTVYLPNGTALLVPCRDLVRLAPAMPEPRRDITDAEQRVVQEVLDEHVSVAGLVPIGDNTWAIYGSIPVDGEVIVAEFDNRAEAESALERIAAAEQETVTS
jgi:hypothetical protein